jgi:hypothetical protein
LDENTAIQAFLMDVKVRSENVLGETHVSEDIKHVIRDLMKVCGNLQGLIHQSSGQSADARMLKKKVDQTKGELRMSEDRVDSAKKLIFSLIEEVKVIANEAGVIIKRNEGAGDTSDLSSAVRIRTAAQKMIEQIVQAK